MPSVDVVSKVDLQALDNATNNTKREIAARYDFKNIRTEITFDRKASRVHIVTVDDRRVKSIMDVLIGHCVRLKVDPKCLSLKMVESSSGGIAKADVEVKEGIPVETSRKIAQLVKGLKLKVQPAIQDDQVRLTGKNIDDLQEIMRQLREQDYGIPLQFVNMKG